jgi:hypothetical protein
MRYHELVTENFTKIELLGLSGDALRKAQALIDQMSAIKQQQILIAQQRREVKSSLEKLGDPPSDPIKAEKLRTILDDDEIRQKMVGLIKEMNKLYDELRFLVQDNVNLSQVMRKLQANCGQFLRDAKYAGRLLFRGKAGSRSLNTPSFVGDSIPDRRPTDLNKVIHDNLNRVMLGMGYTATRGNSIMCTSDLEMAREYGSPYLIFPLNGFSFTWSTKTKDLYTDYFMNRTTWEDSIKYFDSEEDFIKNELKLKQTDFISALKSGHEIYIKGRYYALSLYYYKDLAQELDFT